ncbi:MAG TPA: pilus assembly protein PilP [Candidatus Dormibacteraeota bacterium]|nr:pilus assembly protein PilP [Candidatus Dormibacteraeota bacterium]
MTRLARECVNSVATLVIVLIFGTTVWAQATPVKKQARSARPAASSKLVGRPAHRTAKRKPAHVPKRVTAAVGASPRATPAAAPAAAPSNGPGNDQSLDLVGKRDPFVALVNTAKPAGQHLPPGKAGLVIGTLTVQGTVQGANGMFAVIANPDERVYFVREGDRLYDGQVEKISLDSVTFQQDTKDAFGKPIERTVVKRIYPSAGDQQ